MFLHVIGHAVLRRDRLCLKGGWHTPGLPISVEAANVIRQADRPVCVEFSDPRNPKAGLNSCKAAGLDRLLVYWVASHPRQRLQLSLCRSFEPVLIGGFGSSVIGVMHPHGRLFFRHKQYAELVYYDPVSCGLVRRVEKSHGQSLRAFSLTAIR